jgi:hypothetical protein
MPDAFKQSIRESGALRPGRAVHISAALLALAITAAAQNVCNPSSLSTCEAQAKSDYTVCVHDNPKGSTICSKGLNVATAACQKQFGVCSGGVTCQNGVCANPPACPVGSTMCGGQCKNLQTDPLNCGACGNACSASATCSSGACVAKPTCDQNAFNQCMATATANDRACLANVPDTSAAACGTALYNATARCQTSYASCSGSANFSPSSLVLTVLYAPPGNASTVEFDQNNSEGTTCSASSSFGKGASLTFTAKGGILGTDNDLSASFGINGTDQSTNSFQITATSTEGAQIKSVSDNVDHTQDQFFLLLNPWVTVTQTGFDNGTYTVGTKDGEPQDILNVSVAEMLNPTLIPAWKLGNQNIGGFVLPGLSSLCADPTHCAASDFAQILALDPLVSADTTQPPSDSTRFVLLDHRSLEGPDAKGQAQVPDIFGETDAQVKTTTNTETQSYNVSIGSGGSVGITGIFTLQVEVKDTWTWTNSTSHGTSTGTGYQAKVTLASSTVACGEWVDIYSDLVYHTFAYVVSHPATWSTGCSPATSALKTRAGYTYPLQGSVSTGAGPAAHQLVLITLANKTVQRVYTDSQGNYTLDSVPPGPVQVSAGSTSAVGAVAAGRTAVINLKMP